MWTPLGVSRHLLSWQPDHLARLSVLSFKQIIPLKANRASGQPSPMTHTLIHFPALTEDGVADFT